MDSFQLKDKIALAVLFIAAFWLWTIPLQNSQMPFGEHDAAYIFAYGDEMSFRDKSFDITGDTPLSTLFWYAGYNPVLGPTGLQYPPPYNLGYALAQIFGSGRIVPPYIFVAVTCFLSVFSVYFLARNKPEDSRLD